MVNPLPVYTAGILPLLLILALPAPPARAADDLSISDPWVRLMPGDTPSAGYGTLHNRGEEPVRLTGASSPAFDAVMMHRSVDEDGISRMAPVEAIEIPADGSVALAPGGYHLMLMRPQQTLQSGDTIPLTLRLDDGRQLSAEFPLRPPHATGPE